MLTDENDLTRISEQRPYCRIAGKVGVNSHTKTLRKSLLSRDGNTCWICQQMMPENDCTVDHILPSSMGGESTLANLKLAHRKCNSFRDRRVHLSADQIVAEMIKSRQRHMTRKRRKFLRKQWKAATDITMDYQRLPAALPAQKS